jgi:DNA-binding NarL/FixJ family response regulator
MTPVPVRIVLIDDHDVFRAEAHELLHAAGYVVVGEAPDAAHGLEEVRRQRPDAVLLDVQLPDEDGFSLAAHIAEEPDAPAVVLISSREAVDYGSRLDRSVATGFIHKPDISRATIEALIGSPNSRE